MDKPPVLCAGRLCKSFGSGPEKATVLMNVSLKLYPGSITLLMGPSGSGKSTLLSVLSGLQRPDSGSVITCCSELWSLTDKGQHYIRNNNFGYVFQGYNLLPALTAVQQLEIVLRWGQSMTAKEARQRAEKMLSSLRLEEKMHLRPHQLSGGEKQRVSIGRALAKRPKICFADEPTSNLDWYHGQMVMECLRDLADSTQTSFLVVTHDHRLEEYANQILDMQDGSVKLRGL